MIKVGAPGLGPQPQVPSRQQIKGETPGLGHPVEASRAREASTPVVPADRLCQMVPFAPKCPFAPASTSFRFSSTPYHYFHSKITLFRRLSPTAMLVHQLKLQKGKIQDEKINQVYKTKRGKSITSWNQSLDRETIKVYRSRPLLHNRAVQKPPQIDAARFLVRIGCLQARLGFLFNHYYSSWTLSLDSYREIPLAGH